MNAYRHEFYRDRYEKTVYSANTVLSLVLERIPAIHSAVDIGCGVGTWLSVLQERGVADILGVDGHWVERELLRIPHACFMAADLFESILSLPRRFDLAICLEVAEHLPSARTEEFVDSLARLADHVLFSAAIPFQGGRNHVNEQWQHYWAEQFAARGYGVNDFIRAEIWDDQRIPYWYRQNILLFSRLMDAGRRHGTAVACDTRAMPLDIVHPELYLKRAASLNRGKHHRPLWQRMFGIGKH
jgi:SAM-dependent methyltransferase